MGNLKISKETAEKAKEVAKANGFKEIFVNDKGEFFSNENFASLSVAGKKEKYGKIDVSIEIVDGDQLKKAKGTNDIGTVVEVVADIEAATEFEAVEAILTAEKQGKSRVTVIEAAGKKIKQLTKSDE